MTTDIAIDIGGSRARALLSWPGDSIEVEQPWGVPLHNGRIDVIQLGRRIRDLTRETLRQTPTATRVGLSLAGVIGRDPAHDDLHDALRVAPSVQCTVVASDLVAALVGGLGELTPGGVAVAGTGQAALSHDGSGGWRLSGGWGPQLGDEGSGYWIGREGLMAALRARDGRPAGSATLLELAEEMFGSANTWPTRFQSDGAGIRAIAAFAPKVTTTQGHDPMAASICERAVDAIAESIHAVMPQGGPVALAGGVFAARDAITQPLERRLEASSVEIVPTRGTPADGVRLLVDAPEEVFGSCPWMSRRCTPG